MNIEKVNINDLKESDFQHEFSLLTEEKRKKISGYTADDFKLTLAGRILLRRQIGRLYGYNDYTVKYNENGKPLLDFCFFSISHSGEYAICAVSDNEIGIDIQKTYELKKRSKYMLFSNEESNYVNEADDFITAFFTVWTMKEAYVKAVGGLLCDAAGINLITENNELKKKHRNFSFSITVEDGYIYTVCKKVMI